MPLNEDEALLVRGLQLLTMKPMIYAANVAEADLADAGAGNAYVQALKQKAAEENCEVIIVSAQARCSCGVALLHPASAEGSLGRIACCCGNSGPRTSNVGVGRYFLGVKGRLVGAGGSRAEGAGSCGGGRVPQLAGGGGGRPVQPDQGSVPQAQPPDLLHNRYLYSCCRAGLRFCSRWQISGIGACERVTSNLIFGL